MKRYLPLSLFFILIVFLYFSLGKDTKKLPSPLIGKPFPDITLSNLHTNKEMNTLTVLKERAALVNVWASWCVTCLAEHQLLLDIKKQNNLFLVGVNYKDIKQDALAFLDKYGNPFDTIIFDSQGKLGLELGVYATPETFLVDKKSIIRYKHIGQLTSEIISEISYSIH